MKPLSRRSALVATAAFSVTALGARTAATADMPAMQLAASDKETTIAPGVALRVYNEGPAIIPGFARVKLVDFVMQPGSSTPDKDVGMPNPMVCHTLQGSLRIVQDGKEFMAPTNYVWTCNTGTKEAAFNDGKDVAVMRMTFLLPT